MSESDVLVKLAVRVCVCECINKVLTEIKEKTEREGRLYRGLYVLLSVP